MAQAKTKNGVPTRDFTDAGTGQSFTKGKAPDGGFDAGAYENYLAAGLVADPDKKAPDNPPA